MGQALAILDHQPAAPRQERISGKVRIAIDAMVLEALPRPKAAEKAGMSEHGLYKALRKPPVLRYMREQMQVLRESAAARTLAKAEQLMDGADSEHVQADMTKWLAGLEGISPITKSENTSIIKDMRPGLTINMLVMSPDAADPRLIDGQMREGDNAKPINGLPQSVPHPSMRNATVRPEIEAAPGKRPRGEK